MNFQEAQLREALPAAAADSLGDRARYMQKKCNSCVQEEKTACIVIQEHALAFAGDQA